MDTNLTPSEIIDALDGTSAVARLCDVSVAAVSQWRTAGIPKGRLMFLRLASPEVFASLAVGRVADRAPEPPAAPHTSQLEGEGQ